MRVLKTLPELKNDVDSGALTLSNINMASTLVKEAQIKSPMEKLQILDRMKNLTKTQCEDKIFKLKKEFGIDPKPSRTVIKNNSETTSRVHVNLSKETLQKIEKVKNLTKVNDLDEIISLLADSYINQKIETKKESKTVEKKQPLYPEKSKRNSL